MGIPQYQVLTNVFLLKTTLKQKCSVNTLHCITCAMAFIACLYNYLVRSQKNLTVKFYFKYSRLKIGINISLKEPYERERDYPNFIISVEWGWNLKKNGRGRWHRHSINITTMRERWGWKKVEIKIPAGHKHPFVIGTIWNYLKYVGSSPGMPTKRWGARSWQSSGTSYSCYLATNLEE